MAGRRAVQTPYSDLKMFAMMKLRLSEFYKDPTLAAGMAAMAIGARDAKYLPYREARLPATLRTMVSMVLSQASFSLP